MQRSRARQQMIRAAIASAGVTKGKLATRIGVTPQTLSSWQKDPDRITLAHLARLASAVGWDESDIGSFVQGR